MVMSDIFDKLKNLQSILVRRYELEKQISETPMQLESQKELLSRLRKEYKIILYERGNDDESNYVMDMSYKYMFFMFTSYDFYM